MHSDLTRSAAADAHRVSLPPTSFCIITHGARPQKLRLVIESIRRQHLSASEIIVVGVHRKERDLTYIPANEDAAAGRLGRLRNLGVSAARGENIVILDDDIILAQSWSDALTAHADDFDILTSRVLLPDGTRYWDHTTVGGPRGHVLLGADEPPDDFVYMSGGAAWVMKRYVAERIAWDEDLGPYEEEDVMFSRRCVYRGFRIEHDPACIAYHHDCSYTRVGRSIMRRSTGLDHRWLQSFPEFGDAEALLGLIQEQVARQQAAELADCMRAGIELYPDDNRFAAAWEALLLRFHGDVGGDHWQLNGDSALEEWVGQLRPALATIEHRY